MPRRWRTGLVLVAAVVAFAAGCSGSSEKKLLGDFFRASRLRDDLTLGNFATATFDPRTDGIVESFDVTSVSDEKVTPVPLKQYVKDIEDAKAADTDATTKRREFYNANSAAIARFAKLEAENKPIPPKDQPLKSTWDKWVQEGNDKRKAVSDAQRRLGDARGMAELSLSRPERRNRGRHHARRRDGDEGSAGGGQRSPAERPAGHEEPQGRPDARESEGPERQGSHRALDRVVGEAGVTEGTG